MITRQTGDACRYAARFAGRVGMIPCVGGRDPVPEERLTAASANSDFTASGDVVLDAGGSNKAFGHCTVERVTGTGLCVFNGGTGRFSFFRARVAVTPVGGVIDAWDGTYSFSQ